MDAIDFLVNKKRMCKDYKYCDKCAKAELNSCNNPDNPELLVSLVEEYAQKHPIVTNADKFEEVFGYELVDMGNGCYCIGSRDLKSDFDVNEEYKEPKGDD